MWLRLYFVFVFVNHVCVFGLVLQLLMFSFFVVVEFGMFVSWLDFECVLCLYFGLVLGGLCLYFGLVLVCVMFVCCVDFGWIMFVFWVGVEEGYVCILGWLWWGYVCVLLGFE